MADLVCDAIWSMPRDRRLVVLIDGGSGSGKTTLARQIVERYPEAMQLVSLDDVYPGWSGLAAGSAAVAQTILDPTDPHYRRWNWETNQPAEIVELSPALPLVIEGCGAVTPRNAELATFTVFLDIPLHIRKERALARDGDAYRPYWEMWARQEAWHWQQHHPEKLADLVLRH